MVVLAVFGAGACTQTTNAPSAPPPTSTIAPDHTAAGHAEIDHVCVSIRLLREHILVGRRGEGIELDLGGGACEPPGSGISDMSAAFAPSKDIGDAIEAESCPEFQARIARLWASRQHTRHGSDAESGVRAGPFTITDSSDLFELQSPEGRQAAAEWISQTLSAVRPCWDNFRQDHTHHVVDLLYGDLRKSAPAAIDAAVTQARQHEYQLLHALSPEEQARQEEDQQLRIATKGGATISEDQRRQARAGGRPWIAIEGFTVDRVDRASNGPGISIDFKARIKNVGSAPTAEILTNVDWISFVHIGEHSWAQRRINACDKAAEFGKILPGRIERVVKPGEEISLDVSTSDLGPFYPNDIVYGDSESDYLVAVGCLSYSLSSPELRGSTTFAYVIGKKVKGKFVRFSRGDGVVLGKNLKWLSLHQDYEQ